jgi:hypothetical protein
VAPALGTRRPQLPEDGLEPLGSVSKQFSYPAILPDTPIGVAQQVHDLGHITSTTGNDRPLDALIVRQLIETACRRGGSIVMQRILDHVEARGEPEATGRILRYRDGTPAGHDDGRSAGGPTTFAYTKAGLPDVTAALITLTGEPHPLLPNANLHPLSPSRWQQSSKPEP